MLRAAVKSANISSLFQKLKFLGRSFSEQHNIIVIGERSLVDCDVNVNRRGSVLSASYGRNAQWKVVHKRPYVVYRERWRYGDSTCSQRHHRDRKHGQFNQQACQAFLFNS